MFTPKSGKLLKINGNTAQCMAQATDVAMPNASQFIFILISVANIIAILLQNYFITVHFNKSYCIFATDIICSKPSSLKHPQFNMKKKLLYYIGFFIVLLFLFWIALAIFTDTFNQSYLPKRSKVKAFSFYNQNGKIFSNNDMKGKVCVIEYFFTTCPSVCPRMNANMKIIYETFKDENKFLIVSHTCNPKQDSVATLKHFADSLQVDNTKWIFLTGRKDSLYNMARFSYGIDDPKNQVVNIDDDFMHSQFFALVDKEGIVRGQVYDGLKKDEIEKLKKDIKSLLKEKANNKNFSNNMFN